MRKEGGAKFHYLMREQIERNQTDKREGHCVAIRRQEILKTVQSIRAVYVEESFVIWIDGSSGRVQDTAWVQCHPTNEVAIPRRHPSITLNRIKRVKGTRSDSMHFWPMVAFYSASLYMLKIGCSIHETMHFLRKIPRVLSQPSYVAVDFDADKMYRCRIRKRQW